jgi:dihydroflavonol-4-reductase
MCLAAVGAQPACRALAHAPPAQAGLPVVVLNPGEVYGARDTALVTAGNLKAFLCDPVVLLPRTGGTSICAVQDVAAACVAALTRGRPGERYILGGPNVSVEQLARATLALAGGRHPRKLVLRLPSRLLLGAVRLLAALRLPVPVEPGVLAFAVLYWYVDSSKAAAELGYTQRSTAETLAPAVAWLREAGHFK